MKEIKNPTTCDKLRKMITTGEIDRIALQDAIRIMEAQTKRTNDLRKRIEELGGKV